MKKLKAFTVNFASLAEGKHYFDFYVDKAFFKHFEGALVQDANVDIKLELEKRQGITSLTLDMTGFVPSICDVCNENFDLQIEGKETLVIKFIDKVPEDSIPEVMYLEHGESSIHLATTIYELLSLSIPMRKVHPMDEEGLPACNPKVLDYLNNHRGDEESPEEEDKESINPIWNELKKLKK